MSKAVLVVSGGVPEVVFQDETVEVYIFDLDIDETYLYRNNFVCRVLSVDNDGSVTLRCIDTLDATSANRSFIGVDPSELDFYDSDSIDNYETD